MENELDRLVSRYRKYFKEESLDEIKEIISSKEDVENRMSRIRFKDPEKALLLSLLFGFLGVDRFYIGDNGLGVGKLLTSLICIGVIWEIVDYFYILDATKNYNLKKLKDEFV